MFRFLILPYFVLEMIITYYFIKSNGFIFFVLEALISAIIGIWLMTKRPMINLAKFTTITPKYILSEFGFVAAGFLLAVPLIFSDILGVCVLVISLFLYGKNSGENGGKFYQSEHEYSAQNHTRYKPKNDDVIDAEIIEEKGE